MPKFGLYVREDELDFLNHKPKGYVRQLIRKEMLADGRSLSGYKVWHSPQEEEKKRGWRYLYLWLKTEGREEI